MQGRAPLGMCRAVVWVAGWLQRGEKQILRCAKDDKGKRSGRVVRYAKDDKGKRNGRVVRCAKDDKGDGGEGPAAIRIGRSYSLASAASVSARMRVPSVMEAGVAYSSARCDTPARQGMKSMAAGAMRAMKLVSW